MAREAILEINCSRYSERIIDVINLFNELGWRYILLEVSINLFLKNGSTVKNIWKFQQCWQFVTKYKNMHNR